MYQKPIRRSKDVILGYTKSVIASVERNDCSVKALAVVNNWEYDQAHKELKENIGRGFREGASAMKLINYLKGQFEPIITEQPSSRKSVSHEFLMPKTVYTYKKTGKKVYHGMTIGAFLKLYPTGSYYVIVKGHAFAIVDGEILGEFSDILKLRRVIISVFKVK